VNLPRPTFESADTVNRVVALLVRFPQIHSLRSNPADASLTLTYAVARKLEAGAVRALADALGEHVRAFFALAGDAVGRLTMAYESAGEVTFVHVTRDLATFSPDEPALQAAVFAERFGDALLTNPQAEGEAGTETGSSEESVELALDAMRDPLRRQRLVGVREEQRVAVYFVHPGKRTKVRARS
jgi:hypothetical protein